MDTKSSARIEDFAVLHSQFYIQDRPHYVKDENHPVLTIPFSVTFLCKKSIDASQSHRVNV